MPTGQHRGRRVKKSFSIRIWLALCAPWNLRACIGVRFRARSRSIAAPDSNNFDAFGADIIGWR